MKNTGKYDTSGLIEDEYEPGSNNTVLKNILGITSREVLNEIESENLAITQDRFIDELPVDHKFTVKDILRIHRVWLEDIFPWAGKLRTVNMTKRGFIFAAAHVLPKLMEEFEKNILSKYTPCIYGSLDEVLEALSIVHVEFQLIHPFREGNGRTARIFSTIMALQAGLPFLDFSPVRNEMREQYFQAVRNGVNRDYELMKEIFRIIIHQSVSHLSIFHDKL